MATEHPAGWMTDAALEWLREKATDAMGAIVEVGVWRGRSTSALIQGVGSGWPEKRLYSVDTWADHTGDPVLERYYPNPEETYEAFLREFEPHIRSGRLGVLRMRSVFAAEWLRGGQPLSMVFIDASHTYADVRADILAWEPLVWSGGLLCGHDYGAKGCDGVARAVDELLERVEIGPDTIWSVRV